jgi:hypothetical protein
VQFPYHVTGYFSLGNSSDSTDPSHSGNKLFGATVSNIWRTGLQADARYSKFNSAFASGTYSTLTITRDLFTNLQFNVQGGNYSYTSNAATNSASKFVNLIFDSNLGSHFFVESMWTAQRGGSLDYNQWTTTFGVRFNNRASSRKEPHAGQP